MYQLVSTVKNNGHEKAIRFEIRKIEEGRSCIWNMLVFFNFSAAKHLNKNGGIHWLSNRIPVKIANIQTLSHNRKLQHLH